MKSMDSPEFDALRAVKIAFKFLRGNCLENRKGFFAVGLVDELKGIEERMEPKLSDAAIKAAEVGV